MNLRKFGHRTGFILFGVLVSLISGEIGIRLISKKDIGNTKTIGKPVVTQKEGLSAATYHQPNTEFVFVGNPGSIREFSVPGRWNSQGFNDREFTFEKAPDTFRIVVLGDSYVEALQVPLEKSFHKLLEADLNRSITHKRFEVISFGASGNGAKRNFQSLEQLGMRYNPDLVLMGFLTANDVRDDSVALQVLYRRQAAMLRKISPTLYRPNLYESNTQLPFLFRHSKLFGFLAQSSINLKFSRQRNDLPLRDRIPIDYFVYTAEYDKNWQRAWQTTLDHIKKVNELAAFGKSAFVLVALDEPFKFTGDPLQSFLEQNPAMKEFSWDIDRPHRIIRDFCRDNEIKLLDLEPLFAEDFRKQKVATHYAHDGHWNERGHELAASFIFNYLQENGLVR